jgi:hypothetical protein
MFLPLSVFLRFSTNFLISSSGESTVDGATQRTDSDKSEARVVIVAGTEQMWGKGRRREPERLLSFSLVSEDARRRLSMLVSGAGAESVSSEPDLRGLGSPLRRGSRPFFISCSLCTRRQLFLCDHARLHSMMVSPYFSNPTRGDRMTLPRLPGAGLMLMLAIDDAII